MIQPLLCLFPPETWVCLLALAGILMVIGFRKAAFGLAVSVLLIAMLSPFIDSLIYELPPWILAVLMFLCGISLLRLILGRRVADHIIGRLLYDLIRMPFRFIGWIFRGPGRRV